MADRKRLLLHIGTNKTGSSSLQALMARERKALAARKICYPLTDRPPFPNRRKHLNFWRALKAGSEGFQQERELLLAEFAASGADTLVLSEEHLSQTGLRIDDAMRDLADRFEIEVLCFLRRQDRYLESWWSQRCKTGRETLHIDAFVRSRTALARINYLALLQYWAGFARVTAIGFEQACKIGLTRSFNKATGLDLPEETHRRNVSPSARTSAILAGLNGLGEAHDWASIEAARKGPKSPYALGAGLRAEILRQCAEQNAELAERHAVVFPKDMPEEPLDPIAAPTRDELESFRSRGPGRARAPGRKKRAPASPGKDG